MRWFLFVVVMQAVYVVHGYRQEKRQGLWSWSKFVFALAFAALESSLIIIPILTIDSRSPRFLPILCCVGVVAALNFIWFIIVCRRWKLPDGRTSLQAYDDVRDGK